MYYSINCRIPSTHERRYLHKVYLTPFNYTVNAVAKSGFALVYFNGTLKMKEIIILWNELLKWSSAHVLKIVLGEKNDIIYDV